MKPVLLLALTGLWLGTGHPQTVAQPATPLDSLAYYRSALPLVMEMADLIKRHAYFHGGTAVFHYDTWVDTTNGLNLYVGEQVVILGGKTESDWYFIDFSRRIQPANLQLDMGGRDNFMLTASKRITQKQRLKRGVVEVGKRVRRANLLVFFFTNRKKRTTDFGELHNRLATIIRQLTTS